MAQTPYNPFEGAEETPVITWNDLTIRQRVHSEDVQAQQIQFQQAMENARIQMETARKVEAERNRRREQIRKAAEERREINELLSFEPNWEEVQKKTKDKKQKKNKKKPVVISKVRRGPKPPRPPPPPPPSLGGLTIR